MVLLDGSPLSIADVVAVARHREPVAVADALPQVDRSAAIVAAMDRDPAAVAYGVTTGFGGLAQIAIPPEQRGELQQALVRSHAAGMGEPLDPEVVRGMTLLRARTLTAGWSGVRRAVIEALVALINCDIHPWVPRHGSLGASGDLAPLAHVAAVLIGEGSVMDDVGRRLGAVEALERAGLAPLQLGPKEGLALINGTDAMAATMALAVTDLADLLDACDCSAAMTIEALLGTVRTLSDEIVSLRAAPGQQRSATQVRHHLEGSEIVASHRSSPHLVQDAYSLRCTPQVHGAARDLLDYARTVVTTELGSVVDNPIVLRSSEELASSGNFHGQALAYAADCAAILCADVAAISERRTNRMLDPARSQGLPAFLTADPGRNSGFMIAQYTQAALVTSLRAAATPLSVQSLTTSAGQEDHVSMGFEAAMRTRQSVADLRRVLAIEMVCAAQALELRSPLRPAPRTAAVVRSLRQRIAPLREDRVLAPDLEAAEQWMADGGWRRALEEVGR